MLTIPVTMGSTAMLTLPSFLEEDAVGQESYVSFFLINCWRIQTLILQNQSGPLSPKVIPHRRYGCTELLEAIQPISVTLEVIRLIPASIRTPFHAN